MKNPINPIKIAVYLAMLFVPFALMAQDGRPVPVQAKVSTELVYGKYGCTSSKYRGGSYEYTPRGSFTITKNGQYTYFGFENPSKGTYTVDKKGNLAFKGGYFDGGQAEKIDRPNKFFVVFAANPDNRWTCG